LLYVVRRKQSPLTKKTVNVWKYNDGSVVPVVDVTASKPTNSQIQGELNVLQMRYKNLEESNAKLYQLIERLREENDQLKNEVQAHVEKEAGVDL